MLLFYVRHGDPVYYPDSLTPLGERQAEAVSKRLAVYGLDEIYASTSERAQLTAKPTAEVLKKEIKLLDFCNEIHTWFEFSFDDGQGRSWIFQKPKYRRLLASREIASLGDEWYDYPEFKQYPFKDGVMRVNRETDAFMRTLGYEHNREKKEYTVLEPNDKRIALFAHQGFGICFLSSILDIPYPMISNHFDMCHTGITVIEFKDEDGVAIPTLLTLSNDSHIFREGLPLKYNNSINF